MKKLSTLALSVALLSGCFDNSDDEQGLDLSNAYIAQLVAADYSGSEVAAGNLSGDRSALAGYLSSTQTDFVLDTYKDYVYQIGRFNIDTLTRYDINANLLQSDYTYSLADDESSTSNVYQLIHAADDKAYLLRYGKSDIQIVDPTADEDNFVTASIDLSAYNPEGTTAPSMNSGLIIGDKLYVILERQDSSYAPGTAYLVVIDTTTDTEVTVTAEAELKGLALNATNPQRITTDGTYLYIAGRGDYASNSGALDRVALSDYTLTNIINGETLASLNDDQGDEDASNDVYFHVTGVEVLDEQAFVTINLENGYSTNSSLLYRVDLNDLSDLTKVTPPIIEDKKISLMRTGPAGETLWVALDDAEAPFMYVFNADLTQNGDTIELDSRVSDLEFVVTND